VKSGSSWEALSIGDRLSAQATIRLGEGDYVELKGTGSKVVLSQKGTYVLKDILASSRALGSAGVGKALVSSLTHLASGPAHNQSTAAGMRGANESKSEDSDWVSSSAQVFLDAGEQYLQSGQYDQAIEQFDQARDAATDKETPQVQYYLAYANCLRGDTREALKQAADLQPSSGEEWASDFIILKAKLLLDSSAFAQEIAWLTQSGNDLSGDAQRSAIYNFLLAVGYRGVGDTSNEKASLSKVVAMSEGSDLAKAATELLQNP
jgi:tetratricopeptide (TPR) repeat protein